MAINDSLLSLTEREMKHLKDSWTETFIKKIFPQLQGTADIQKQPDQ
jgi:hypothetical protein